MTTSFRVSAAFAALFVLITAARVTAGDPVAYRGYPAAMRDGKQLLVRPGDEIDLSTQRGHVRAVVEDASVWLHVDTDRNEIVGQFRLVSRYEARIDGRPCREIREELIDLGTEPQFVRLEKYAQDGIGTILTNFFEGVPVFNFRTAAGTPACTTHPPLRNRRSFTVFLVRKPGFTVATEPALHEHFIVLYAGDHALPTAEELRSGRFSREQTLVAALWPESAVSAGAPGAGGDPPSREPRLKIIGMFAPEGIQVRIGNGPWRTLSAATKELPLDAEIKLGGNSSIQLSGGEAGWGWIEFESGFEGRIRGRAATAQATSNLMVALGLMLYDSDLTLPDAAFAADAVSPRFETPVATIEVKGTRLSIAHGQSGETSVEVQEGYATVTPKNRSLSPVTLAAGQRVMVTARQVGPVTAAGAPRAVASGLPQGNPTVGLRPMPAEGPPTTMHTFVHHQVTTDGMAGGCFPVLSDDGRHIVVAPDAYPCPIQVMAFDGSGRRTVMQTDRVPGSVDISADGSRILASHNSAELFTARPGDASPRVLVRMFSPEMPIARLSGDGRTAVFLLGRKAQFEGDAQVSDEGLWRVDTGGGGRRQVVTHAQVQRVLGLPKTEGVAWNRPCLDVSHDGGRIVFGVVSYSPANPGPKIFTVRGDGSDLRLIAEGTRDNRGDVGGAAITPNGRFVAYKLVSWGRKPFVGFAGSAGGDARVLAGGGDSRFHYPDGNVMSEPMSLSDDGAWLLLGTTGLLVATDGGERGFRLPATRTGAGKVLLSGAMLRATMDRAAKRFAYFCGDERNAHQLKQLTQLATLEIDPPGLGAAPRIFDVVMQPTYLIPNKQSLTIKARVTTDHKIVVVTNVAVRDGMTTPVIASELLYDDGRTVGDETAGDGLFTNNRIYATTEAKVGPYEMRVDAEIRESNGRRHATVLAIGPVPVLTEPPSEPAIATTPPMSPPAGATGMRIEAEHRRVAVDDVVTVPVWLKDATDVANINFEVMYDAAVARPEGEVIKGNILSKAIFSANPRETGRVRLGFAQTGGLSGTGTVAYLPMRAVGRPGDKTPLDLLVTTIDDPGGTELSILRIPGSILIVGPGGEVPGDCDGDGVVTAADAMCALKMSVGNMEERAALDVDANGSVTSGDARILLKRAVGLAT